MSIKYKLANSVVYGVILVSKIEIPDANICNLMQAVQKFIQVVQYFMQAVKVNPKAVDNRYDGVTGGNC